MRRGRLEVLGGLENAEIPSLGNLRHQFCPLSDSGCAVPFQERKKARWMSGPLFSRLPGPVQAIPYVPSCRLQRRCNRARHDAYGDQPIRRFSADSLPRFMTTS